MPGDRDRSGTTKVSPRAILRAANLSLSGSGLMVREVTSNDGVIRMIVAYPSDSTSLVAGHVLTERLGYAFWIDLGLVDHTPVYDLVRMRRPL